MKADGPADVLSGRYAETQALTAARDEVRRELDRVKRTPPLLRDGVALLRCHSARQVHWVHLAARTAREVNLIEFLALHAPPGADENYGGGHEQASGGALRIAHWNAFVAGLGFGREAQVQA